VVIAAGVAGALVIVLGILAYALVFGWFGERQSAGEIAGSRVPATELARRMAAARVPAAQDQSPIPIAQGGKQILFGDLHVHTTFSLDAFQMGLPLLQGEGVHPVADACDFARYCSALDFWSINDHVEGMTPAQWRETKDSIRQCNASAGDPANPDLVAYLGWEWTQIGSTPDNHYGHKNVVLRDTQDDRVPVRPIAAASIPGTLAAGAAGGADRLQRLLFSLTAPGGDRQTYFDFALYSADRFAQQSCPHGVAVRALPDDCLETAATPAELFAKLADWGYPSLVIPHGTTWGFYTPPGTTFDKQLKGADHDPGRQRLFEIYSGHGNSEQYRPWRATAHDVQGKAYCPAPSENYLPSCWRAGELIRARCTESGESAAVCDARASAARQHYVDAGVSGFLAVPGQRPEDWRDSGQCRDCFLPSFNYRPGNSGQYALAIRNFDDPEHPKRFRFGFMGSSDNHFARAGTGYKEIDRWGNTEGGGASRPGAPNDPERDRGEALPESRAFDPVTSELAAFELVEIERQASFFMTGGLIAVHAPARDRGSIWDAMVRREVYATSGDRVLLWFDLENGPEGRAPMGSEVRMDGNPRFVVRAAGAFAQEPGCPDYAKRAVGAERLARLCKGECYNPGAKRKPIVRIEVVRIRPQSHPDEPVETLIEDVWKRFDCPQDKEVCEARFDDPGFAEGARDAVYYVRAIEQASPAVNGANLRCEYDEAGRCVKVNPCYKDYRTPRDDNCMADVEERAWSSPIFVDYATAP